MKDLFGNEISEAEAKRMMKAKKPRQKGYAAPPGSGPKGETCKTCQHIVRRRYSKVYLKCGLMERHWTCTTSTDIRAKAPACRNLEKPNDS